MRFAFIAAEKAIHLGDHPVSLSARDAQRLLFLVAPRLVAAGAARYPVDGQSKSADADGEPAGKQTIGLLQRRHITIGHVIYIGRESNQLEDVEAGLVRCE